MRATHKLIRVLRGGALVAGAAGALGVAAVSCDASDAAYAQKITALATKIKRLAADKSDNSTGTKLPSELPLPDGVDASFRPPLFDPDSLCPDVDVAVHNAAVTAQAGRQALKAAGVWDGPSNSGTALDAPSSPEEAMYVLKTARPAVTTVTSADDAIEATHTIGVVTVTRGCHPAVAAAVQAQLSSAAKSDQSGLVWYLVSDATPPDAVSALEQRMGIEIDDVYGAAAADDVEGALPTVLLADRYKATYRKYLLPLEAQVEAAVAAVEKDGAQNNSATADAPSSSSLLPDQVRFLLSAAVPSATTLSAWAGRVLTGAVQPTLLGEPRPQGDAHPTFPWLKVVTSSSFSDVVLDPAADVAVEAYLTDCPMCMALGARVRMAGYLAHKYFPYVRVGVMNVDNNERPRQWMPGPAFPTIQMFNGGGNHSASCSKLGGPTCKHHHHHSHQLAASPPADAEAPPPSRGRLIGLAKGGSPACVPSLDFSHPTAPGRMALPSVRELVAWIGAHASIPFNPETLTVPAGEVLDAARRFPEYAEAIGLAPVVPPLGEEGEGSNVTPQPSTVSLASLCDDMEVEARVFETGVFQSFWFSSVAEQYAQAFGPHTMDAKQRAKLERFKHLLGLAKGVVIEGGMYGRAEEAEVALDVCDEFLRQSGLLAELKAKLRDDAEADTERQALQAATQLLS